jgi:FkbM family methyltransferase
MNIANGLRLIFRQLRELKPVVNCYSVISEYEKWYIYVNLRDQRGRSLILNGLSQPLLSDVWETALKYLSPDVVIDVGANYGEFGLGIQYRKGTKVLLVEANPTLNRYLKKSISSHPNTENIELAEILACAPAMSGKKLDLFVDSRWSGYSSVIIPNNHTGRGTLVHCPCETVDSFLHNENCDSLVFKIDVEGYEGQVLEGMKNIFKKPKSIFGIVEFNRECLIAAGCDPHELIRGLESIATLYRVSNDGDGILKKVERSSDIPEGKEDVIVCNDLSLVETINGLIR